ncbi:MAG: AI-2E family transporter [Gammaproteobacteria bacterium]|nr:AI-2E family transporter [Gammaproteobacteria bacterium]
MVRFGQSNNQYQYVVIIFALICFGWLFYLLSPVLSPFLFSALLAYLFDPLADQLENRKLSRTLSVVVVFATIVLLITAVLLWLVPALEKEITKLLKNLPGYIITIRNWVLPWLEARFGLQAEILDTSQLIELLKAHWQQAGGIASAIVASVSKSGIAIASGLMNVLIIPVVTFYLLRDWDVLVEEIRQLLPRNRVGIISRLTREADQVLGAFLRGQFSVMIALGIFYSLGLSLVGLDYAFLIGMISGLISFIPYLGSAVGLVLSTLAAAVQYQDWTHVLFAAGVFGLGQLLEGFVFTPLMVGNKVGLHPVTVIFAIMAGGQLFGFAGVLLGLPVASVLMVLVRHGHELYKSSNFYNEYVAEEGHAEIDEQDNFRDDMIEDEMDQ